MRTFRETLVATAKTSRAPFVVEPLSHAVVVVTTAATKVLAAVTSGAPKAATEGATAAAGVLPVVGAQEAT